VKKNYQTKTATRATVDEIVLPATVTVAMTELAGAVREGLLALAVGAGLQVMQTLMAEDVTVLCGPKGRHDANRGAVRHGTEAGSVVLGGRTVPLRRPRVRGVDGTAELTVPSYGVFSSTELLDELALEKMMAKLSTRRYRAGLEPVGSGVEARARSTSKSAVTRRFINATERALDDMMHTDLTGLDLVAVMIDGVHFAEHLCVVALGIGIDGTKHPLGVVEGSTENSTVVKSLLCDLRDRGLDVTRPILVVIDGAKALASAVREIFDHPAIQRCQLHKTRNVEGHLPDALASTVAKKMRAAYHEPNALLAEATLEALAKSLDKAHPGAAASLREGLAETLTITRLGVPPTLARTLRSTNAIESMIEICRDHSTNVKRWRDGTMALRWCAAGMNEAEKQFRRVNGYLHLPALRVALNKHFQVAVTPTCENDQAAA
jgi:transposase-like protein